MLPQPTLETDRLILRPLSSADAPAIQRVASTWAIANTTLSIPHPYPDDEAERYIARQQHFQETGYALTFAVERKSEPGCCGIIEARAKAAVADT